MKERSIVINVKRRDLAAHLVFYANCGMLVVQYRPSHEPHLFGGFGKIGLLSLTERYSFSASSSHFAITAAISLLFFSSIMTWLLPLMPISASRMYVGLTPAWRR